MKISRTSTFKLVLFFTGAFLLTVTNGFAQENQGQNEDVIVEAFARVDADESKYKTFGWASQVNNETDSGMFFLNDVKFKADIKEAVKDQMQGLGYEHASENPDLLVNFRVFDQPTTLRGYDDINHLDSYDDYARYWSIEDVRVEQDSAYNVEAGTLIVSILDKEDGELVWQGFASGLIDQNAFIKDEQKIERAVELIFDEFEKEEAGYSKKN